MNFQKELSKTMKDFAAKYPITMFEDKATYAEWLAQTYFFVRHSTALLGYALPHLDNDGLRHHFEKHLGEETRHDLLALKDIEKLGASIKDFKELTPTQAFYQSQYYRISFEGGTSLLGYILFLEAMAVQWGREIHEHIKDIHKGSVLFLKVHAEEDPQHVGEAIKAIMGLTPPEQEAILRNFHYSHETYAAMMDSILKVRKQDRLAA